jgi:saccharopine dehydrogenase-like NADP-dependent oxidoreductase
MANSNYVTKVAIVGASGNSGKFMTEALLSTGKHIVTALTRLDSQACFPDGVAVRKVDYSNVEALTEALRGQDALVITLGGHTPPDVQTNLVKAAGEAGVPWVLPNEWSPDTEHEPTLKDVFIFKAKSEFQLLRSMARWIRG